MCGGGRENVHIYIDICMYMFGHRLVGGRFFLFLFMSECVCSRERGRGRNWEGKMGWGYDKSHAKAVKNEEMSEHNLSSIFTTR